MRGEGRLCRTTYLDSIDPFRLDLERKFVGVKISLASVDTAIGFGMVAHVAIALVGDTYIDVVFTEETDIFALRQRGREYGQDNEDGHGDLGKHFDDSDFPFP